MGDYNAHSGNYCRDVLNQTDEDRRRDHDNAAKYRCASNTPVNLPQRPSESLLQNGNLTGDFQYIGHRTIPRGRLVLDFMHEATGEIVCRFFNVDIQSAQTGRMYRVGEGGQFTTQKGHKFRRFWRYFIGEPPYRWSRVHTELHKLKAVSFIGTAEKKHTTKRSYWNLKELRKKR